MLDDLGRKIVDVFVEVVHWRVEDYLFEPAALERAHSIDQIVAGADQGGRRDGLGGDEAALALRHEGAMAGMKLEVMFVGRARQMRHVIGIGVVDYTGGG